MSDTNKVRLLDAELDELKKSIKKIPALSPDIEMYIKYAKENEGKRIGILADDVKALCSYKKGDIVLFTMPDPEKTYLELSMPYKSMVTYCNECVICNLHLIG